MKRIHYLYIAAAALSLSSCKNEMEEIFDDSAAIRMEKALSDYTQRLNGSKGGWVMEYYATSGARPELIAIRFNSDGSCTMGMKTEESGYKYIEDTSLWGMVADNGPVLSFNTYNNCLHAYATPDPSTSSHLADGYGYEGDYEFMVIKAEENADTIMLKGKKRGTYNRLTRLPEGTDFNEFLNELIAFNDSHFTSANYALVHFGEERYRMDYGEIRTTDSNGKESVTYLEREPVIYPIDGYKPADGESYTYSIVKEANGDYRLRFNEPLKGPNDEAVARNFVFNNEKNIFVCQEDEGITITGPVPAELFNDNINNGGTFLIKTNTDMSDNLKDAYKSVSSRFTALKYSLTNIGFSQNEDGKIICNIAYKNANKQNVNTKYIFGKTAESNKVTLKYEEPEKETGRTLLANISELQALLDTLSATYTISSAETDYIVTTFKLTNEKGDYMVFSFN